MTVADLLDRVGGEHADGVDGLGELRQRDGAGLVEDGVMARELIQQGEVLLDGEVETRRGRQLVAGDVVAVLLPPVKRSNKPSE